jgi:hypothetical protein
MVVFGRPKGYRGSYIQHREGGIVPQVVLEVLSPNNRLLEMVRKHRFYQRYGVEEYYVYDPETGELGGYRREGEELREIAEMRGWVSPRLGVRFDLEGTELRLTGPDGKPFATYVELTRQRDGLAQQRDELAQQRALAEERANRLAARLRELGVEVDLIENPGATGSAPSQPFLDSNPGLRHAKSAAVDWEPSTGHGSGQTRDRPGRLSS